MCTRKGFFSLTRYFSFEIGIFSFSSNDILILHCSSFVLNTLLIWRAEIKFFLAFLVICKSFKIRGINMKLSQFPTIVLSGKGFEKLNIKSCPLAIKATYVSTCAVRLPVFKLQMSPGFAFHQAGSHECQIFHQILKFLLGASFPNV